MKSKKGLAISIILLFIGLSVAPSINADVSKEALVEFTTEACGLDGRKQTVKLTKEDADEVEDLFDSIREKLNATESREEAEEIFKEAVVELDKYGLLGGLSIKQAQRLVTGRYKNSRIIRFLGTLCSKNQENSNFTNSFCTIAGCTGGFEVTFQRLLTQYFASLFFPILYLTILFHFYRHIFQMAFGGIYFGIAIGFGIDSWDPDGHHSRTPAIGWLHTNGTNGIKQWNGTFWGGFSEKFSIFLGMSSFYTGCIGFTGIQISNKGFPPIIYFLGSAIKVKISSERPY